MLAFGALLASGLLLSIGLASVGLETPLGSSLVPAFRLLGGPLQSLDRLAGRVLPVDEIDESELGLLLRERYEAQANPYDLEFRYVNELLAEIARGASRPFDYRAYVADDYTPNAFALPGGTIVVTRGLLRTLRSEAELAAVLAHELAHVELGHCFSAVKLELLARKGEHATLGRIADLGYALLLRHTFSKTQEDEADQYAYTWMEHGSYDPRGQARAFDSLLAHARSQGEVQSQRVDPLRDYVRSHPPLELRRAEFLERAKAWWRRHRGEARYVGRSNLTRRRSLPSGASTPSEWVRS